MIHAVVYTHLRTDFTMQINVSRRWSHRAADAGFSLLELMVVVVIMSILALVVMPRIIDRPDQARAARVQSDLAVLAGAIKLYKLDNFRYPSTEQRPRPQHPSPPITPPTAISTACHRTRGATNTNTCNRACMTSLTSSPSGRMGSQGAPAPMRT
jgi:prepilin-type N-terminal cleavage/methylation domain-containing protein